MLYSELETRLFSRATRTGHDTFEQANYVAYPAPECGTEHGTFPSCDVLTRNLVDLSRVVVSALRVPCPFLSLRFQLRRVCISLLAACAASFVRDKDAVIASLLIAEMTAYHKESGRDPLQVLDELQQRHGYFHEELLSIDLHDIAEANRYVAAYEHLPAEFAGSTIIEKRDYFQRIGWDYSAGLKYGLELPQSHVLHYTLSGGSWFAVRPSGTEPKVKCYLGVCASTAVEAQDALKRLREAILLRSA